MFNTIYLPENMGLAELELRESEIVTRDYKAIPTKIIYAGQINGLQKIFGEAYPFGSLIQDGEFSLEITAHEDIIQVYDSRNPSLIHQVDVESGKSRFFDTERKLIAEQPVSVKHLPPEQLTFTPIDDPMKDRKQREVTTENYESNLAGLSMQIQVTEPPELAGFAETITRLLIPFGVSIPGLPEQISIQDQTGAVEVKFDLQQIKNGSEVDLQGSEEWQHVQLESLLSFNPISMGIEFETKSGNGSTSFPEIPLETFSLRELRHNPDFGWLINQGYLDKIRETINRALKGFTKIEGDLDDLTIDWWKELTDSLDYSNDHFRDLRLALLLLRTFFYFSPPGDKLPNFITSLWGISDPRSLLTTPEQDFYDDFLSNLNNLDNEFPLAVNGDINHYIQILPGSVFRDFYLQWRLNQEPQELERWIALVAAIGQEVLAQNGMLLDDKRREQLILDRLEEVANQLWGILVTQMSNTDMPGEPLELSLPKSERKTRITINASDINKDINLPGWVSNVATISVTANSIEVKLGDNKLSRLTFDVFEKPDRTKVPVIAGEIALKEVRVDFAYNSRPAISIGNVVGVLGSAGKLAEIVTAVGNGRAILSDVRIPFALESDVRSRELHFEFIRRKPEIGNVSVRLWNYLPSVRSLLSTLVQNIWINHSKKLIEALQDAFFDELEDMDALADIVGWIFRWPDIMRLYREPGMEPLSDHHVAIMPDQQIMSRGGDILKDRDGFINVPELFGHGNIRHMPSKGAVFEPISTPLDRADAGFIFSLRFLETWLLNQARIRSHLDDRSAQILLDELDLHLEGLHPFLSAEELREATEGFQDFSIPEQSDELDSSQRGVYVDGVGICHPPAKPSTQLNRKNMINRFSPTFSHPQEGRHQHALEIQQKVRVIIRDELISASWIPEVTPKRCFLVPARKAGEGPGGFPLDATEGLIDAIQGTVSGRIDRSIIVSELEKRLSRMSAREYLAQPDTNERIQSGATQEKLQMDLDGDGYPIRMRKVSFPEPIQAGIGDLIEVCVPGECNWIPDFDHQVLRTYLFADVTIRAKVRVGFRTFGWLDAQDLTKFLASFIHLSDQDMEAMLGWLPQLQLELVAESSAELDADLQRDVALYEVDKPFKDVPEEDLRQALISICQDDLFRWLGNDRSGLVTKKDRVGNQGGLVTDAIGLMAEILLGSDDWNKHNRARSISSLLMLAQKEDDDYHTAPEHIVEGDYVYIPVELFANLKDLFEA